VHYQTHWRLAFVLAFFFHLVVWLVLMQMPLETQRVVMLPYPQALEQNRE